VFCPPFIRIIPFYDQQRNHALGSFAGAACCDAVQSSNTSRRKRWVAEVRAKAAPPIARAPYLLPATVTNFSAEKTGGEQLCSPQINAAAFSRTGYSTSAFGSGPSWLSHHSTRL
jgi:hypothetical protein